MTDKWIDISVPLRTGMVHWPGDPEPILERIAEIDRGDEVNVTFLRMTAHSGTHMDAPCHFLPVSTGMEHFPLEFSVGRARVISVPPSCSHIGLKELENQAIEKGDRILFKTRNSSQHWEDQEFQPRFTGLSAAGARFLSEQGVSLVGIDYLSIGVFEGDGAETHKVLLNAGIWILEGLYLGEVEEGDYELICLPLKVEGSDGAPARAILRRWNKQG